MFLALKFRASGASGLLAVLGLSGLQAFRAVELAGSRGLAIWVAASSIPKPREEKRRGTSNRYPNPGFRV